MASILKQVRSKKQILQESLRPNKSLEETAFNLFKQLHRYKPFLAGRLIETSDAPERCEKREGILVVDSFFLGGGINQNKVGTQFWTGKNKCVICISLSGTLFSAFHRSGLNHEARSGPHSRYIVLHSTLLVLLNTPQAKETLRLYDFLRTSPCPAAKKFTRPLAASQTQKPLLMASEWKAYHDGFFGWAREETRLATKPRLALKVNAADSVGFLEGCPTS